MTPEEFLSHISGPVRRTSRGWQAHCPAHQDRSPSLAVAEGERGLLVKCWAGCTVEAITRAMGMAVRDLFYDTDLDPVALHQARAQRQAQRMRRLVESHVMGLEIDSQREAQRFIERTRNLDISNWTDTHLNRAYDALAAAHHRLQAEGPDYYYDFTIQL